MPREPPSPRASVSHTLLGVVVLDPGVPGRRERAWGFSEPIPREGAGALRLRVGAAADLTWRDVARGVRAAAVLCLLWSAGQGSGADCGAG